MVWFLFLSSYLKNYTCTFNQMIKLDTWHLSSRYVKSCESCLYLYYYYISALDYVLQLIDWLINLFIYYYLTSREQCGFYIQDENKYIKWRGRDGAKYGDIFDGTKHSVFYSGCNASTLYSKFTKESFNLQGAWYSSNTLLTIVHCHACGGFVPWSGQTEIHKQIIFVTLHLSSQQ
jgi:hypothetical protein